MQGAGSGAEKRCAAKAAGKRHKELPGAAAIAIILCLPTSQPSIHLAWVTPPAALQAACARAHRKISMP